MTTTVATERSRWKSIVLPSEHGGWGLTLEPVLLGLLIAPSVAGAAIGVAAFFAFLVRTPLKLALVDVRRDRWLARSALALQIAIAELVALVVLALVSTVVSGSAWMVPIAAAVPFVLVQLWFDVRSRSRRLIPELCGAVGMAAVVAAIVMAAGKPGRLAIAAWLVLAARSIGAIPFVRVQIVRLRRGAADPRTQNLSSACEVVAVGMGGVAVIVDQRWWPGAAGLVAIAVLQTVWLRRPPTVAKVLGMRQMALGLGLVAVAAIGVGALS
jgi:hypothetical protein